MEINNFTILNFPEVESTNELAFKLIKENRAFNNFIITADSQTKGRGRQDRNWISPVGNLYLSLILQFEDNKRITDYSFLTACAIGETLRSYQIETKYKWPNDIILNEKKLAGILLQCEKINNVFNLIIGVGLNLTSSPEYAISLADYHISKEDFIKKFTEIFADQQNKYQQFGFRTIKDQWKKHAYKIGEKIKLSNGMEGIFSDIDENANLLLRDDAGKLNKILADEIL